MANVASGKSCFLTIFLVFWGNLLLLAHSVR